MSRVARVLGLLGLVSCLLPGPVRAQRILAVHPLLPTARLTASGTHLYDVITNRFVVGDDDQVADLYRYSVANGTWLRVPRAVLLAGFDPGATLDVLALSDDGRYAGYVTTRPTGQAPPDAPVQSLLVRYDLLTGSRVVVRDSLADPFAQPVMSRDGSSFAWVGANNAVLVTTVGQTPVAIGQACPTRAPACPAAVLLTSTGSRVLYAAVDGDVAVLETFDRGTLQRRRYDGFRFEPQARLATTTSGTHVLATTTPAGGRLFDLSSSRIETVSSLSPSGPFLTDDAAYVPGAAGGVFDVRLGAELPLTAPSTFPGSPGYVCCLAGLSADGRIGLAGDTGRSAVVVDLDGDADGMFDPWEQLFGFDPTDAGDAPADADADGTTNAAEFARRSHPRGLYRQAFAEGTRTPGVDTAIHVFLPPWSGGGVRSRIVLAHFLPELGSEVTRTLQPWGLGPVLRPPADLAAGAFATVLESEVPIVAERITSWGVPQRAAHASAGVEPARDWYFAEGATLGGLQTFFALANPGDVAVRIDAAYLMASGQVERRRYEVPARSRRTIWVNQEGGPLAWGEMGAHFVATAPVMVERLMYLPAPGGFGAGTASPGASAPASTWWFAEGSTGGLFDTYLLLANPGPAPATVTVAYRDPFGASDARSYAVPPESRRTIAVGAERLWPTSGPMALSLRVDADVPIVAERSMWWRAAGTSGWGEGHAEVGETTPALTWAVADMPESAFLLIANAESRPGRVRVTYWNEMGGGAGSAVYELPPDGRVTAWPTQDTPQLPPGRYRATITSAPTDAGPAVRVVVERSAYDTSIVAGTTFKATPVP